MPPDDETPPRRPKWVAWALIAVMALAVLGMLNLGWRMLPAAVRGAGAGAPGNGGETVAPTASIPGRTAVEGADCLRCHGMDRNYVGPAFRQIAVRYSGRPDAAEYLARKIREGGVGEWGRVVMPRQPQVSETQALDMAQWLLSLAPPPGVPSAAEAAVTR